MESQGGVAPCACKGSIRLVHVDCLLQWVNHQNRLLCEVCHQPYGNIAQRLAVFIWCISFVRAMFTTLWNIRAVTRRCQCHQFCSCARMDSWSRNTIVGSIFAIWFTTSTPVFVRCLHPYRTDEPITFTELLEAVSAQAVFVSLIHLCLIVWYECGGPVNWLMFVSIVCAFLIPNLCFNNTFLFGDPIWRHLCLVMASVVYEIYWRLGVCFRIAVPLAHQMATVSRIKSL